MNLWVALMNFIINQRNLAKAVGVGEIHISRVLSNKKGISEDLAARLEQETGIKAITWAAGRRSTVKRLLRSYFENQKLLKKADEARSGEVKKCTQGHQRRA